MMGVHGTKHNLPEFSNSYWYLALYITLTMPMNSIMIFNISPGRSASSARIPLKLNIETFEEFVVAGTDAK